MSKNKNYKTKQKQAKLISFAEKKNKVIPKINKKEKEKIITETEEEIKNWMEI